MRKFINIINESVVEEASDDFKDPMLDKPDNGDQKPDSDFDMFKQEGDAGAPTTATEIENTDSECEPGQCEEVGQALNASDMKVFVSAYKKLCAGAIESIDASEAKELAEIMLALFKSKVEQPAIEESNQDNKLARDAAAQGQPAPENPNAPKKPLSPEDARQAQADAKAQAAQTNNQAPQPQQGQQKPQQGQQAQTDDEESGDEAAEIVRKAGVQIKK